MEHSFNTKIAEICGIEEAILLNNIFHWVQKNKSNDKHFYENRYWTYNSYRAFADLFPYMAPEKTTIQKDGTEIKERELQRIRRAIQKLIKANLLIDGNFNKKGYDRTKWYSLTDLAYELLGNEKCVSKTNDHVLKTNDHDIKNDAPIPDSKLQIENTDKEKIKLHSVESSNEDFNGEKPVLKSKENTAKNPFSLTDSDMNLLRSYHKGFIEEIDKVAKTDYDKKIIHLCRTFKMLKHDRDLLKDIYVYFRTFRDHGGTYTNEIRSLRALSEKIERILPEMTRETKRKIQETGSVILHKDLEKKILVYYNTEKMKQADRIKLDTAKAEKYHIFDLSKQVGLINLPEIGYTIQRIFG